MILICLVSSIIKIMSTFPAFKALYQKGILFTKWKKFHPFNNDVIYVYSQLFHIYTLATSCLNEYLLKMEMAILNYAGNDTLMQGNETSFRLTTQTQLLNNRFIIHAFYVRLQRISLKNLKARELPLAEKVCRSYHYLNSVER